MNRETSNKLNHKIKFAEKNNEKSVFLKHMKDAKESRKQKQAEIAITRYNSWKRG